MKRFGNLFQRITDIDNLHVAHINARKGKGHYREVKMVNSDPDTYILGIREMLLDKTFTTSEYQSMEVFEPKRRTIHKLPYYPDRIVHHAIMQVIQPIWDRVFIRDLYSAIPGRGLHKGSYRLRDFIRRDKTKYCLKFDVSKFYPSIQHDILFNQIQKKIKCRDTLWLLNDIIESIEGVPIGNYLSQYFGNIYLNEFDHWLKEEKHQRYYIRYCDDGVILNSSKSGLHALLDEMREYLDPLNMHLNNKTRIFPSRLGIDFLGYVHYQDHVLLRKASKRRFVKRIPELKKYGNEHVRSSIMSSVGWLTHCNSYKFTEKHVLSNPILMDVVTEDQVLDALNKKK